MHPDDLINGERYKVWLDFEPQPIEGTFRGLDVMFGSLVVVLEMPFSPMTLRRPKEFLPWKRIVEIAVIA